MLPRNAFLVVLAMAGSLLLAGCYTFEPVNPEEFRKNPELLQRGDTVTIHSSDQPALKGKILEHSSEWIVLNVRHRVQETVSTDKILTIEVRRLSPDKTVGLAFLGALGAAAVVGIIYGMLVLIGSGGAN